MKKSFYLLLLNEKRVISRFLECCLSAYAKRDLILHYPLWTETNNALSLNFRDKTFFCSNLHSNNYSTLAQIWCWPLLLDLCPIRNREKCASWLTAGWATWLQRRHLMLPSWGDSLPGSLWKLTAKHSQLDLCYFQRLSFSPRIKAGLDQTCTLRHWNKLTRNWWPAS